MNTAEIDMSAQAERTASSALLSDLRNGRCGSVSCARSRRESADEIERLQQRVAELEADAARYRFLRSDATTFAVFMPRKHGHIAFCDEALDGAVDEARGAAQVGPPCPPIEPIRQAAREVGYAVGEHGSKKRDYDLIAVPWTDEAVGNHALVQHLLKRIPELIGKDLLQIGDWERKPFGRYACTLQIDGWYKHIDLSIAPRAATQPAEPSSGKRCTCRDFPGADEFCMAHVFKLAAQDASHESQPAEPPSVHRCAQCNDTGVIAGENGYVWEPCNDCDAHRKETERLTRPAAGAQPAEPPRYYCKNCHCADCGNTRAATPTAGASETQPAEPPSDDAEDAANWRALRNCARITAIGSAGCQPGGESYDGPTAHVTLNFWTHNAPESESWHREWLDTFVAKARRLAETKGEGRCIVVDCGQAATKDGAWCDKHYNANHIWP